MADTKKATGQPAAKVATATAKATTTDSTGKPPAKEDSKELVLDDTNSTKIEITEEFAKDNAELMEEAKLKVDDKIRVPNEALEEKEKPKAEKNPVVNHEANNKLVAKLEQDELLKKQKESSVDVAELVEKQIKTVKVQFIKNHSFNIGVEKIEAVKGDKLSVEAHLANKFVSRDIAYILG